MNAEADNFRDVANGEFRRPVSRRKKFRVTIFASGSHEIIHDDTEMADSHLAVRQKYLDAGFKAHQLNIMAV